jgi:DNA helicase IV
VQKQPLVTRILDRLGVSKPENDPIFSPFNINRYTPSDSLDPYQRQAAYSDATKNLVVAGAGSGKSRVLIERVIYLIRHGISLPRIRVITFTNAATEELRVRLRKISNFKENELDESVSTIHKLALRCLKEINSEMKFWVANMDLVNDPVRKAWDEALDQQIQKNPELTSLLAETVRNLNEHVDIYELYSKQNHFSIPEIDTLSGVKVRSKLERKVANYLFSKRIRFEYESPVLFAEVVFRPDFYLPEIDAYIEVLGLWNHHQLGENYRKSFEFKRAQMEKYGYGYACLELFPNDLDDGYERKIEKFIVRLKGYSKRVLYKWEKKIRDIKQSSIKRAVKLFYEIDQSLIDNETPLTDYQKALKQPFLSLLPYLFEVRNAAKDDVQAKGILNDSHLFKYVASHVTDNQADGVDFVFIDEFQDVQPVQMSFLKHFMTKSFYVVGDPRQSIYGFLGGSTYFIDHLHQYFRHVKRLQLRYNYRSQKKIVELSNKFLPFSPNVISAEKDGKRTLILLLDSECDEAEAAYSLVKREIDNEPLMVLGRFSKSQSETGEISLKYQNLAKKYGDSYYTFHQSKGREADNVLIIGCNYWDDKNIWECVPAKNSDHPLKAAVTNSYKPRDKVGEERRLFYVAMTRARKHLILVCQKEAMSPFLAELKSMSSLVRCLEGTRSP